MTIDNKPKATNNCFNLGLKHTDEIYTSYILACEFVEKFLTQDDKQARILCPCDTVKSNIFKALKDKGFVNVDLAQDFYNSELLNSYDIVITNPHLSCKKETFELLSRLTCRVYLIYSTSITNGLVERLPFLTKKKRLLTHILKTPEGKRWSNATQRIEAIFLSLNDYRIKQDLTQFKSPVRKYDGAANVFCLPRYLIHHPINQDIVLIEVVGKTGDYRKLAYIAPTVDLNHPGAFIEYVI